MATFRPIVPLLSLLLLIPLSLSDPNTDENPWGDYAADCLADQPLLYDPLPSIQVPWHIIDLDQNPHDRWREIATTYGEKMGIAISKVRKLIDILGDGIWEFLLYLMTDAPDKFTQPYRDEINAMAEMAGLDIRELTLLNMFYEISKGCTSLVAMDINGKVFHARNLDFGTFFIWDVESHTWELTNALKDVVVNLEFVRGGKRLFKAVTFAGHLGILTAIRPGQYTLSTNTRFGSTTKTLIQFFLHGLEDKQLLLYANRDMFTNCETFEEAKAYIESVPLLAQGYFIMGTPTSGMVITRAYNGTDHEAVIDPSQPNGWYVLETNYDWNEPDIYLDDRTIPGNKCMQQLGRDRVSVAGIYQVLSSKTNLNKATVYTSIMEVETGFLETFIRHCDDPCWFV